MDPHFAVAHYQLGQALVQKHSYDETIAEFRKAIELSGRNGTVESNLANAYAVSGREEEAMIDYGDFLEIWITLGNDGIARGISRMKPSWP